jgi:hypothetical protein
MEGSAEWLSRVTSKSSTKMTYAKDLPAALARAPKIVQIIQALVKVL